MDDCSLKNLLFMKAGCHIGMGSYHQPCKPAKNDYE
jgi:hypothetical protein